MGDLVIGQISRCALMPLSIPFCAACPLLISSAYSMLAGDMNKFGYVLVAIDGVTLITARPLSNQMISIGKCISFIQKFSDLIS